MKCKCGGKSYVVNTINSNLLAKKSKEEWIRRQRKCEVCKSNFYTAEVFYAFVPERTIKSVYTEKEAEKIKHTIQQKKVDVRRMLEDIKENKDAKKG